MDLRSELAKILTPIWQVATGDMTTRLLIDSWLLKACSGPMELQEILAPMPRLFVRTSCPLGAIGDTNKLPSFIDNWPTKLWQQIQKDLGC